jgi:hypothetical protein
MENCLGSVRSHDSRFGSTADAGTACRSTQDRCGLPAQSRATTLATVICLASAVAICAYYLVLPPVIGVANNGDFYRVMHKLGLYYPGDVPGDARHFRWTHTRFIFGQPKGQGLRSSTILAANVAVLLNGALYSRTCFDIRSVEAGCV